MSDSPTATSVAELNDRLAREHPIDDDYARSSRSIRFIEQQRLLRSIGTEVFKHTIDQEAILPAISRLLQSAGSAVITVSRHPLIDGFKSFVKKTPIGWVLGNRIQSVGGIYFSHKWRLNECLRILERYCFRCVHR